MKIVFDLNLMIDFSVKLFENNLIDLYDAMNVTRLILETYKSVSIY